MTQTHRLKPSTLHQNPPLLPILHTLPHRPRPNHRVDSPPQEKTLHLKPLRRVRGQVRVQRFEHSGEVPERGLEAVHKADTCQARLVLAEGDDFGVERFRQPEGGVHGGGRLVKEVVQLEHEVHGEGLVRVNAKAVAVEVVNGSENRRELEVQVEEFGELGEAVAGGGERWAGRGPKSDGGNSRDFDLIGLSGRASGESLQERGPLNPLDDAEVQDVDVGGVFGGFQDGLVSS